MNDVPTSVELARHALRPVAASVLNHHVTSVHAGLSQVDAAERGHACELGPSNQRRVAVMLHTASTNRRTK